MTSIAYDSFIPWANYHQTIGATTGPMPFPSIRIEDQGRIHGADVSGATGPERFAATAAALHAHLGRVAGLLQRKQAQQEIDAPFAAGMVGRGWSFSPLIGTEISQLMCDGLNGCVLLEHGDLAPGCHVPAKRVALVGGGARLREIVTWAERFGLSIHTSGTHLGPTIGGGFATASHGSRLGYGGLQNMVLGMHLITGANEHIWIEPATRPVLRDNAARKLDPNPRGQDRTIRIIRDDAMFEDALIHLGAMGIVNCVAMELVPNDSYDLVKLIKPVDVAWLDTLSHGDFAALAAALGHKGQPAFYEMTLDPHDPFGTIGLHTMYFPTKGDRGSADHHAKIVRPADAIVKLVGNAVGSSAAANHAQGVDCGHWAKATPDIGSGPAGIPVPMKLFDPTSNAQSVYEYYAQVGHFPTTIQPGPSYSWGKLHQDEITGGIPGALYNASFAMPLSRVAEAIPAVARAVHGLPRSFVFTLRFVSNPAGTLAFTRFEENAVLEIDGLSPMISRLVQAQLAAHGALTPELKALLDSLAETLPKGAMAVRAALDQAHIPFSMHWAKLGGLDRAKVYADFGDPRSDPDSLIARWRKTRDALLRVGFETHADRANRRIMSMAAAA